MTSDPDKFQRFVQRVGLEVGNIIYLAVADEQVIRRMVKGIVFLVAWWSGTSIQPLAEFVRSIAALQPHGIDVLVIDVDGAEGLCRLPELGQFVTRGAGESLLMINGKIADKAYLHKNIAIVEKWVKTLTDDTCSQEA
jgi:hypothetical protein